jgi:adhesin/invasin
MVKIMVTRISLVCGVVLALVATACDTVPLTAPSGSALTVTAASNFVPTGGTTEVTAFVVEEGGLPVQNGTSVRFTTNLGRMDPPEALTRNGYAVSTFIAGESSGVADVVALAGGTGGTAPSGGDGNGGANVTAGSNKVTITVGAAAVDTVLLAANPSSVPNAGGTVDLLATVSGTNNRSLSGILVSFASSEGQLGSSTALTDANGHARTTLTTNRPATVTASAGGKISAAVTVTRRDPPSVATASMTATGATPVPGVGQSFAFSASITVTPPDTSIIPTRFEWIFGDGTSATTNGPSTTHIYTTGAGTIRTVSVRIELTNGQTIETSTQILLGTF